jgi:hypothetical protein
VAYAAGAAGREGPLVLVATEWWNYWPLAYLTYRDERIEVVGSLSGDTIIGQSATTGRPIPYLDGVAEGDPDFHAAREEKRIWFVEFARTPRAATVRSRLAAKFERVQQTCIRDWGNRPIITILRPLAWQESKHSAVLPVVAPATLPQRNTSAKAEKFSGIIKPNELTLQRLELGFHCRASAATAEFD